jgi:5-methyltetrahydrofolate--homocysteine methyltransferase
VGRGGFDDLGKDFLKKRVLLIDGAMGTMLQESGLPPGGAPELLNLTEPGLIKGIHAKYAGAGADVLTTNTFGGTGIKLAEYGLKDRADEINRAAVRLAREAADESGRDILVAGDMGPTGSFLRPVGELSFDAAYDAYAAQAESLAKAGADLILIETMSDIKEVRAAVIAAKSASGLPVIVTMTFQADMRTLLGTPPDVAVTVLTALGCDMVGANCSLGPEGLYEVARAMSAVSRVPLVFQPNAGLPRLVEGKTVYPAGPEVLAEYAEKFIELGAGMIGSCCGSTPEHTRAMAGRVREKGDIKPTAGAAGGATSLTSRTRLISIGRGCQPAIIGERINPTGRPELTAELTAGKVSLVKKEAREQTEAGASLIDLNVGLPGGDEANIMPVVVRAAEEATELPLVIDSTDPSAIEAALKEVSGKCLVNSVTGDKERLESVLPLVKKYGAAVVGLTVDERGVPATADERVEIARRILDACLAHGIPKDDLVIDPLVLTASAEQDQAEKTLQAVRMIKEGLGLATSLGISNVSFGLPGRALINATYLTMALGHGLDAAMVNPYDKRMSEAMSASAVLMGRDRRAERYIAKHKKERASIEKGRIAVGGDIKVGGKIMLGKGASMEAGGKITAGGLIMEEGSSIMAGGGPPVPSLEDRLFQAVIDGDRENIVSLVEEALKSGMAPLSISNNILIPALTEVGRLFEAKEFFLPQVMQSAETVKAAFARLKAEMKGEGVKESGTVVLATVFGDVHDIGKNILATLLENHGLKVIDLGKNVAKETILDEAAKANADVIGLSALMTTTMTQMDALIKERDRRGMKIPVVLGGAVVTEGYAQAVGAAGSSRDALEAVALIKGIIQKR